MRTGAIAALLLTSASAVQAQAPTIDSYQVRFYAPGAQQPMQQTENFPVAAVVCNQAPPVSPNTVNPTRYVWDDPAVAGRVCLHQEAQGGTLFALPVGSYEATIAAINTAGSSAESNRAPFSRQNVVAAPTGFKIVR